MQIPYRSLLYSKSICLCSSTDPWFCFTAWCTLMQSAVCLSDCLLHSWAPVNVLQNNTTAAQLMSPGNWLTALHCSRSASGVMYPNFGWKTRGYVQKWHLWYKTSGISETGQSSWLACSGWLTHISGHPSAAGRAQDSESTPAKDRRSTDWTTQPTYIQVIC